MCCDQLRSLVLDIVDGCEPLGGVKVSSYFLNHPVSLFFLTTFDGARLFAR